jgi:exodeoxyribonuclease VII small subunit
MAKSEKTFEQAINELENIVDKLEKGELPLEEAMDVFQKGIELSKFCSKKLDEVERKISILVEDEKGKMIEEQFELEG